ncbi:MAG: hypothetical protein A3H44_11065 [Gammaproteobacteria bacterium RIFCSPLOWO2_02_FULL_57_10]|nr:MAG: hypothetical protein A3H44_11065 [Gammaproteobacteria bacterium RIFCSPLOWO2_02_FULL_57_10]
MSKLFEELKRRKVVRVAGVYAVVAWLLIQVTNNIVPALQLPAWTSTLIVVLLLIGFPIALVLAWAFEVSPDGVQRPGADDASLGNQVPVAQIANTKLLYAILTLVLLVAMFQIGERLFFNTPPPDTRIAAVSGNGIPQVIRFKLPVSDDGSRFLGGRLDSVWGRPNSTSLALSPDGSLLAYTGWEFGPDNSVTSLLYLRGLDQLQAEAMVGTEDASTPFFSPDGRWIGYFAGPSLRRIAATGGESQTIVTDAGIPSGLNWETARGASWGDDDSIVYGGADGLYRVAARGGEPQLIAAHGRSAGEFFRLAQPQMLPGSKAVLLHAMVTDDPATTQLMLLDLATGSLTALLEDAMNPLLLDSGQLLFLRRGALMSVSFDLAEQTITGEAVPVMADVMQALNMPNRSASSGAAQITFSHLGHMAYADGGMYPARPAEIVRVRLDGTEEALGLDLREYIFVAVSPDGSRLLLNDRTAEGFRVLGHDLARGVSSRLDVGGFVNVGPRFSPDGLSIAFASDRGNVPVSLHRMPLDNSQPPERLIVSAGASNLGSWSSTGVIAYVLDGRDIWMLPPDGEPVPFLTTDAIETHPTFTPDGQWLAYVSDATGRGEVYVRPYPGPGAALQISGNGGSEPAWSPDGRQLYYRSPGAAADTAVLKGVDITLNTTNSGSPLQVGREAVLIEPWPYQSITPTRSFDVAPDGSFIVIKLVDDSAATPGEAPAARTRRRYAVPEFYIVLNFAEELRGRARQAAQ